MKTLKSVINKGNMKKILFSLIGFSMLVSGFSFVVFAQDCSDCGYNYTDEYNGPGYNYGYNYTDEYQGPGYNYNFNNSWDTNTQINCTSCGLNYNYTDEYQGPGGYGYNFTDSYPAPTTNTGGIYVGDCSYTNDCYTPQTTTYVPTYTNTTTYVPTYTNTYVPVYTNGSTYYGTYYTQPTYTNTYNPVYTVPTTGNTYTQTYRPSTVTTPSNNSSYWNYNYNSNTNTTTNTNNSVTYGPAYTYTNNTCAGTNNCNTTVNNTTNTTTTNTTGSNNVNYYYGNTTNPTPVCTNGATNYPGCTICPTGLVYSNGYCITNITTNNCPTNYYWNGTSCVPQTRTCPNGTVVSIWDVCPNQTQTCWNGTVIPVSSVCPSQYKTCPNGTVVLISQQCYKTCSNGTTVPDTQVCYRVCPNGQSIPETQYCPSYNNYPTVDINANPSVISRGGSTTLTWTSQNASYCTASNGWSGSVNLSGSTQRVNVLDATTYSIRCCNSQNQCATDSTTVNVTQPLPTSHRVVTTSATGITNTSARCNGVGIISNGVVSNGWFEYGETTSLGKVTNSASIGNQPSSPFSNTINNLKPNTTYYCRAVMSNANGTYRGEIVSFKTTGSVINYVPVTPTKTSNKTVVVCTDETGTKETLKEGEKLMTITLDKRSGNTTPGSTVDYRVHYLNTSKIKLSNATVKVVIPSEMEFVSSNRGMYDADTRTVTADLGTVGAGSSDDLIVRVKVKDNAETNKSAVMSSYISYDALDQKGQTIRDENTSYVISTITKTEQNNNVSNTDNNNSAQKSTQTDRSYLPNTVLEWLAIIALIFVLIVLGKAIWTGLKGEEHSH